MGSKITYLAVPDPDALGLGEDDREGVVAISRVE